MYYGFDASSYLEHYGVKGMKWGVRKRKEPSGSNSRSQKREIVSYPYTNEHLQNSYEQYIDQAKWYVDQLHGWGVADEKTWQKAYAMAAEDYSEVERLMLAAYLILKQKGLTYRFSVGVTGDTENVEDGLTVVFYDNYKNENVPSLSECIRRSRNDKSKTREKKVDPNAKAVKVQKGKVHYGATAGENFGVASTLKAIQKSKSASDKLSDRASKSQASKKDKNLWNAKKSGKKYDSIWNR